MSTPHINANPGDFAKTIIMSGDPLRAKLIAETYLEDVKEVTNVRGILGFTGKYKSKDISIMGHGRHMQTFAICTSTWWAWSNVCKQAKLAGCFSLLFSL